MKKNILIAASLFAASSVFAQNIELPVPNNSEPSKSVIETLKTRHSVRNFDKTKELTVQQISNLCWAACGVTRDDKHLTSPTAMNRQEIRLFVFDNNGVYEYDAKANTLVEKVKGDNRQLLAGNGGGGFKQEFVMDAPVSLLMIIDFDKFGMHDEKAVMMGCVDAGNVSENINLYCESVGLATVPRATHDTEGIKKLLSLTDNQLPIMNNPVGYEKK